jgi:hypothetical protein
MSTPRFGTVGGRTPGEGSPGLDPIRGRQAWIGIDVSSEPARRTPRGLYPLFAVAVLVALGVAAVRIDLLRTRYAVSAAMARESELIEEQRQLIVRRRQLRDPVELAMQARERGFRPPTHVVSLPDPTLGTQESIVSPQPVVTTPSVAAVSVGPGNSAPSGSEWR